MAHRLINPGLDLEELAGRMRTSRRVQVKDFLDPAVANATFTALDQEVEWSFALRDGDQDKLFTNAEWEGISMADRQKILSTANRQANAGFQYMFDYYSLISTYRAGKSPTPNVEQIARFVESDEFRAFVQQLTGSTEDLTADGQATRYRPGQYLTYHDDHFLKERRFAYVMNFTKVWRADWGGLLLFHDNRGNVTEGWLPTYNCLNLFEVPQGHSVSFVTPFAGAYRYCVTGWFSV